MSTAHEEFNSLFYLKASCPLGLVHKQERAGKRFGHYLAQEGSTPRLNGLNLGEINGLAAETGRELGNVKEDAGRGSHGTQICARGTANARLAGSNGLLQRTMLLGVISVGAEGGVAAGGGTGGKGVRQLAGGRGRVRLGGVINGSYEEKKILAIGVLS